MTTDELIEHLQKYPSGTLVARACGDPFHVSQMRPHNLVPRKVREIKDRNDITCYALQNEWDTLDSSYVDCVIIF